MSRSNLSLRVRNGSLAGRLIRLLPPRTLKGMWKGASASAVAAALLAAPMPALGADECGVVPAGGTATCTAAGSPYPDGIIYTVDDLTIVLQGTVVVTTNAVGEVGVGSYAAGALVIDANPGSAISTAANSAPGAYARSTDGPVSVTVHDISTLGSYSHGVFALSQGAGADGAVTVTATGLISTAGAYAEGVFTGKHRRPDHDHRGRHHHDGRRVRGDPGILGETLSLAPLGQLVCTHSDIDDLGLPSALLGSPTVSIEDPESLEARGRMMLEHETGAGSVQFGGGLAYEFLGESATRFGTGSDVHTSFEGLSGELLACGQYRVAENVTVLGDLRGRLAFDSDGTDSFGGLTGYASISDPRRCGRCGSCRMKRGAPGSRMTQESDAPTPGRAFDSSSSLRDSAARSSGSQRESSRRVRQATATSPKGRMKPGPGTG